MTSDEDSSVLPVAVCGAKGCMARLIAEALETQPDMRLVGILAASGPVTTIESSSVRMVQISSLPVLYTVIVDFTHPDNTRRLLRQTLENPCRLVIGTSGLTVSDFQLMAEVACKAAVFYSSNFSQGVYVMREAISLLAARFGQSWTGHVLDIHHARKIDTPSATARFLSEAWQGDAMGARENQIAALRFGDGVSEHTFFAVGQGERLEITHRLLNRNAFLPGILGAIRFLATAKCGLYSMRDLFPA